MSKLFNIEGKSAIVTGASSGLGRQFALALAREGANVAILARRTDKLEQVKAEVEALGVKCISVKCDVADNESIKAAVAEVKEVGRELGLPDVLVDKVPIDGLCGKTDEENLGFTYAELDVYIRTGYIEDQEKKAIIDRKHKMNLFKLQLMPTFDPQI